MTLAIATIMALLCIFGYSHDRHERAMRKLREQIEIRKRFGK